TPRGDRDLRAQPAPARPHRPRPQVERRRRTAGTVPDDRAGGPLGGGHGGGLGDLFGFLVAQGHDVRYVGYDLSPRMVGAARAKYADPRARFQVRDIL